MGGSSWSGFSTRCWSPASASSSRPSSAFSIGIARLSPNWLLARLAGGYVEVIRNLPLLFQILFWYLAVLGTLPGPRQSISLFGEVFINNRGLILPAPVAQEDAIHVAIAVVVAIGSLRSCCASGRRRRQECDRAAVPGVLSSGLALIVGLPLIAFCRRRLSDRVRACRGCAASTSSAACG